MVILGPVYSHLYHRMAAPGHLGHDWVAPDANWGPRHGSRAAERLATTAGGAVRRQWATPGADLEGSA
jgi:hypothetical protein